VEVSVLLEGANGKHGDRGPAVTFIRGRGGRQEVHGVSIARRDR
jgi:hypothetical protein